MSTLLRCGGVAHLEGAACKQGRKHRQHAGFTVHEFLAQGIGGAVRPTAFSASGAPRQGAR